MPDRILIDANSLGHAAHQGTILKAGDQQTQAVYGVIKAARALRVRYPTASILFLWDGLSWRKAVSEVYKGNRVDTPEKREARRLYKTQTPYIRKALHFLAMPQLAARNMEADDLAALLVRKATAKGDFVRLITGDQDWLQLVGPNCIWEDHRDDTRKVNIASFRKYTGYADATQFVQSKALQGDISDNLPGVGGIGEVKAARLLEVWGRVEAFLADPDPEATWKLKTPEKPCPKTGKLKREPFHKALKDFHKNEGERQQKFFHNMHMMNLCGELPAPVDMRLQKGEFNPDSFKLLCHELGFSSIYKPEHFDHWVEPFKTRTIN